MPISKCRPPSCFFTFITMTSIDCVGGVINYAVSYTTILSSKKIHVLHKIVVTINALRAQYMIVFAQK